MPHLGLGDRVVTPDAATVVATYDARGCDDVVELVETFYAVQAYRDAHDRAGPATLQREFDVTRSQVESWVYAGSRPHAVNAIETIRERGWYLEADALESDHAVAFATLLAWTFAAGSIGQTYQPYFFAPDDAARARLYAAGDTLGITFECVERDATDQYLPETDATIFGRVLHAAGAPQGRKADQDPRLPLWIIAGPDPIREAALATLVAEAMSPHPRHGAYQLDEDRLPTAFLDQVGGLVEDVTDGGVQHHHGRFGLDVDASAAVDDILERRDTRLAA